ncbi:catechol 2,3-dioxygenase-like lactoylglutathione lyase family enzyme [Kibdelosporangium banguiense]|uniref:Catechol 2,3-dioxygenase-like lactoylglutathione lyase family enzyme n=1 Tax=Kibdelosporangium banguiense TaxID=1365924 RepID=A0ABS4TS49_9PSEU|nr:hypothetical protein [Kibdelosporangium banguiense]MBP2327240.1 catechol 2,3-dioxygenase-like lactoylglutathione lyase family enzyme [Kibdelosporangium banguiense]
MPLPERWFRTRPDSSVLDRPRLLARSLIDVSELDDTIAFYEWLLGIPADLRMPIPDFGGLELAAMGNLLLIASARPFTPIQRRTAYSLIVPSLSRQLSALQDTGTEVLEPTEDILPGSRARVRYPDGSVAELVEHRPQPGEQPRPPADPGQPTGIRLYARRVVPDAEFDSAVALYKTVLCAGVEKETTRRGARLALVGNLLLVGSDELSADPELVGFALLTSTGGSGVVRAMENGDATSSTVDGRSAVELANGVRAEVWELS